MARRPSSNQGTYTACEPCKDKPDRPPLWQVRAARIIHQNEEQMVYYEQARLELWGVPIAYLPFFSTPDPSVKRKTGFLAPAFISNDRLGKGVAIPFFWNIAPNYDVTIKPTFLTRQGILGQAEWRHRLLNGSYNIRLSGIFQKDPEAFAQKPSGPGSREWRGSIESTGKFYVASKWTVGWDVAALSDRWFINDYKMPSEGVATTYFKESISTVYLNGQGDRGYFDMRGYYFRGLSAFDTQKSMPVVRPVVDYNKTIDLPPEKTGIGGQLEVDLNLTSLTRQQAAFQSTGNRVLDRAYSLYDVCEDPVTRAQTYNRNNCLLRGVGGDYTRLSAQATWKRKFIDPIGQVWTPFAYVRADASWLSTDMSRTYTYINSTLVSSIPNAAQSAFFDQTGTSMTGRVMPGAGIDYRYPFVAKTGEVTHIFEPIAQVIVRPNEQRTYARPNEDAQSLVFDDTNLFEWNKFSGYDRTEGGTRVNYGGQYTANFARGGYFNLMAGQSLQVAGRNSYAVGDVANTGINSGLEQGRSDFVTRAAFAPNSMFSFGVRARFNETDLALRRIDASATMTLGNLQASVLYARYAAQPELGFNTRREGIYAYARYKFLENYWVSAQTTLDLDRHLQDSLYGTKTSVVYPAIVGLGIGYEDECTIFSVNYVNSLTDTYSNTRVRSQTILFKLELKTLGELNFKTGLSSVTTGDNLTTPTP